MTVPGQPAGMTFSEPLPGSLRFIPDFVHVIQDVEGRQAEVYPDQQGTAAIGSSAFGAAFYPKPNLAKPVTIGSTVVRYHDEWRIVAIRPDNGQVIFDQQVLDDISFGRSYSIRVDDTTVLFALWDYGQDPSAARVIHVFVVRSSGVSHISYPAADDFIPGYVETGTVYLFSNAGIRTVNVTDLSTTLDSIPEPYNFIDAAGRKIDNVFANNSFFGRGLVGIGDGSTSSTNVGFNGTLREGGTLNHLYWRRDGAWHEYALPAPPAGVQLAALQYYIWPSAYPYLNLAEVDGTQQANTVHRYVYNVVNDSFSEVRYPYRRTLTTDFSSNRQKNGDASYPSLSFEDGDYHESGSLKTLLGITSGLESPASGYIYIARENGSFAFLDIHYPIPYQPDPVNFNTFTFYTVLTLAEHNGSFLLFFENAAQAYVPANTPPDDSQAALQQFIVVGRISDIVTVQGIRSRVRFS